MLNSSRIIQNTKNWILLVLASLCCVCVSASAAPYFPGFSLQVRDKIFTIDSCSYAGTDQCYGDIVPVDTGSSWGFSVNAPITLSVNDPTGLGQIYYSLNYHVIIDDSICAACYISGAHFQINGDVTNFGHFVGYESVSRDSPCCKSEAQLSQANSETLGVDSSTGVPDAPTQDSLKAGSVSTSLLIYMPTCSVGDSFCNASSATVTSIDELFTQTQQPYSSRVPEPASFVMFVTGLLGFGAFRRYHLQ